MLTPNSINNPFSDYNASAMDNSKIIEFWCDPMNMGNASINLENEILKQNSPIVIMGGRATGKTMIFKYFSYYIQKEESYKNRQSLLSNLKKRGGIGFYLRLDTAKLTSFEGKGVVVEEWIAIFTHYFELQICKNYIDVIKDLFTCTKIEDDDTIRNIFITKVGKLFFGKDHNTSTIEEVQENIDELLREINNYITECTFINKKFSPNKIFSSQDLSFNVAFIAKETIKELSNINFVTFIDEYENYSAEQQKIINTLLKFVKPGVSFRVGMRLEGFRTFETISKDEFIKESRDYSKIVIENHILAPSYPDFLQKVAAKRLESVPEFREKDFCDITKLLGKEEDLEVEAKEVVNGQKKHFDLLKYAKRSIDIEKTTEILEYPKNPLIEMLNILWVLRGREPEDVQKIMHAFLKGEYSDNDILKYKRDYTDKYKLSLLYLLCSIYKRNKKYYSFNTFSFLSSGIVGHFIELCRRSFQYSFFENIKDLLLEGKIPPQLQNRAAVDFASSELEMVKRVFMHGESLYKLVINLGNNFAEYHKDKFLRYPETNQFTINLSSVKDSKISELMSAALRWSVILKKKVLQQESPGKGKNEIYTLNRIFSPIFKISHRTRGGFSEKLDEKDIVNLTSADGAKPKMSLTNKNSSDINTKDLFSDISDEG